MRYETKLIKTSGSIAEALRPWVKDEWEPMATSVDGQMSQVLLRRKVSWWRVLWRRARDRDPTTAGRVVYRQ